MTIHILSGEATQWNDSLTIFKAMEDENLILLKECLFIKDNKDSIISDSKNKTAPSTLSEADSKLLVQVLNLRDSSGLTPLLFAADRGLCQVHHTARTSPLSGRLIFLTCGGVDILMPQYYLAFMQYLRLALLSV